MQTTIIKHHSPAEIRGYVHEAEAILTEGGYDDDERIQLLPTIINLLAARSITVSQPASSILPVGALGGSVPGL